MDQEVLGQLDAEGLEHNRPVNGVRRDKNVFTDDVVVGRPVFIELIGAIASCGDVVRKRVEPNISDKVAVEGQLDTPLQTLFRP